MQRLFSAFPNGWPGRGLFLHRVVTAAILLRCGFGEYGSAHALALILPHMIGAGAAVFVLLGLWTPVFAVVVALVEIWIAFSCDGGNLLPILLAAWGVSLAMIGPGAWSVDARLFGRKHFEIRER